MTLAGDARDELRADIEVARGRVAEAARSIGGAFLCCGQEPPEVLRSRLRAAQVALVRVDLMLLGLVGRNYE